MLDATPSPAGFNGRSSGGRFGPGNKAGRGNPLNRRAQRIRAELLKSATPGDIKAICAVLKDGAKGGDLHFIQEWFNRTIGKATAGDVEERLNRLEELLNQKLNP